jgi:hypothetical protein
MEFENCDQNFPLQLCHEIYPLENPFCFIGASPNLLIFGKCSNNFFLRYNYFSFTLFEIHYLYNSLIKILTFLIDTTNDSTKEIVISKGSCIIFWEGKLLSVNEEIKNTAFLCLEINGSVQFKMNITLTGLQKIFKMLKHLIPSLFIFSQEDEYLFEYALKQPLETLLNISDISFHKQISESNNNSKISLKKISFFFKYFQEIFLVCKKIDSLQFEDQSTIVFEIL